MQISSVLQPSLLGYTSFLTESFTLQNLAFLFLQEAYTRFFSLLIYRFQHSKGSKKTKRLQIFQ